MNIRDKGIVFSFFVAMFGSGCFNVNAMQLVSTMRIDWSPLNGSPIRVEVSPDQKIIVTTATSGSLDVWGFCDGQLRMQVATNLQNITKIKIFKASKDSDIYFIAALQLNGEQSKLTVWFYDFEANNSMVVYSFDAATKQKITDFTIENGSVLQVCIFDESLPQPGWVRAIVDISASTRKDIPVTDSEIFEIHRSGQVYLVTENSSVLDLESPISRVKFFGIHSNGNVLLKDLKRYRFRLYSDTNGLKDLSDFNDLGLSYSFAEKIKSCSGGSFIAAKYWLNVGKIGSCENLRLYNSVVVSVDGTLGRMIYDLVFDSGVILYFFDVDQHDVLTMIFLENQKLSVVKVFLVNGMMPVDMVKMRLSFNEGNCIFSVVPPLEIGLPRLLF